MVYVLGNAAVEDIRSAIDSLTLVVDEIEYRRARAIVDQYEKGTPNKYKIYSGQPFPTLERRRSRVRRRAPYHHVVVKMREEE